MTREEFEKLVAEEFPDAIPEQFRSKVSNVAFLVEEEPTPEVRRVEGLGPHETLLGYYRGIPHTARGDWYGVGGTMPDTITLYRIPIEEAAEELCQRQQSEKEGQTWASAPERTLFRSVGGGELYKHCVRKVIRETIWHEVAHHFGMGEGEVRDREAKRQNDILGI